VAKPKIIAVAGPTASGKSELALQLAQHFNGEIVCMDSMQIYRRMDIGTAKPTPAEQSVVPHHMLDIIEPTETYAVADYAVQAEKVLHQILSRGKLPIMTGGTGLYLKAIMHGLSLGGAPADETLRQKFAQIALEPDGRNVLHQKLEEVDPVSADKLHPNDIRRVIRALEVYELTGVPLSQQTQEEAQGPFDVLPLAIDIPRPLLYERLETRVHAMMAAGLLSEVRSLLQEGVTAQMQSMQGIGYKELIPVVEGQQTEDAAIWQIILNTRHYAKRQVTWLRNEPRIVWLTENGAERLESALQYVDAFMNDSKGTKES